MSTSIRIYKGDALRSGRLGIFPGAFNPVTRAHLSVGGFAREQYELDRVIFLLPQSFPHAKEYAETTLEQRVRLLEAALENDPRLGIASSGGGLFVEIAREFRAEWGGPEIYLISGRDAAERIAGWDYGNGPNFAEQLREFQMLVASREGEYAVPAEYAGRIHAVRMPPTFGSISSSAVREAIQAGKPWENLVPDPVARRIRDERLYQP